MLCPGCGLEYKTYSVQGRCDGCGKGRILDNVAPYEELRDRLEECVWLLNVLGWGRFEDETEPPVLTEKIRQIYQKAKKALGNSRY